MTEDEAKTKLCCGSPAMAAARYYASGADVQTPAKCEGSACMAWRWTEAKRSEAFNEAVRTHMRTQAKPNAATAVQEVYAKRGHEFEHTEGGCGLAGQPQ